MTKLKLLILTLATFTLAYTSCTLTPPPIVEVPEITTKDVTNVLDTTATFNGDISSDGGSDITKRGLEYSDRNTSPSIDGSYIIRIASTLGTGIG